MGNRESSTEREPELASHGPIVWHNYKEFMYNNREFSLEKEEYDGKKLEPYWGILPEDFQLRCTQTNSSNLRNYDNQNYHCKGIRKSIFSRLMYANPKGNSYHHRLYRENHAYNGDSSLYGSDWNLIYHMRELYKDTEFSEMFIVEQQKKMMRVFDDTYQIDDVVKTEYEEDKDIEESEDEPKEDKDIEESEDEPKEILLKTITNNGYILTSDSNIKFQDEPEDNMNDLDGISML